MSVHEDLYFESCWDSRKQAVEKCAASATQFLQDIYRIHAAFSTWYASKGAASLRKALEREIKPTVECIQRLLSSDRMRRDSDQSIMEDLGYGLSLWNGGIGGIDTYLSLLCGAYPPKWRSPMLNYVRLDLPASMLEGPNAIGIESLSRVFISGIVNWDPNFAWLSSDAMWRTAHPGMVRGPRAGWLTYFSRRVGQVPKLPKEFVVTPVERLGELITIVDVDRLTATNATHVKRVQDLFAILIDAGLL